MWQGGNYIANTGSTTSFIGTVGNNLMITGFQFEKGNTPTEFEFRPLGIELQLCQRYYTKLGNGVAQDFYWEAYQNNGNWLSYVVILPVAMRALNPTGAFLGSWFTTGLGGTITMARVTSTTIRFNIVGTSASVLLYNHAGGYLVAEAEI